MWRLGVLLAAAPLLAQEPGLDLLLLLENTPGMQQTLSPADLPVLDAADRTAVATFATKTKLLQPFTADHSQVAAALRRTAFRRSGRLLIVAKSPKAFVYNAILDSTRLFRDQPPDHTRAIILIFGTNDPSLKPSFDELKRALLAARIHLYPVAIRRRDFTHAADSRAETPPTFPGRTPPVPTDRAPLPEDTFKTLQHLAAATGGEAFSGKPAIGEILIRVHSGSSEARKLRLTSAGDAPQGAVAHVPQQ